MGYVNRRQSLQLDFDPGRQLKWPEVFEERLKSLRDTPVSDAPLKIQGRNKPKDFTTTDLQFVGTGDDLEDDFHAIGWLNALPDQCGIPGWQRITFMKHFAEDLDEVDSDNLWAYEGVVLPGARVIVGRWWFASETVDFNVSSRTQPVKSPKLTMNNSKTTTDRSFFGHPSPMSLMRRATPTILTIKKLYQSSPAYIVALVD